MARCGIWLRYPVKIIGVDDAESVGEEHVIGDAETLGEAIAMVERNGFQVRDNSDGGNCRLVQNTLDSKHYFIVTICPQ